MIENIGPKFWILRLVIKFYLYLKRNFAGIKLYFRNPFLNIKIIKIIVAPNKIFGKEGLKELDKHLSKKKFNILDSKKNQSRISFFGEGMVYYIKIQRELDAQLKEEGTVLEIGTENYLNTRYRNKLEIEKVLISFYNLCNIISKLPISKRREEITINISIDIKTKEKEVRLFSSEEQEIVFNKSNIMISTEPSPNLLKVIFYALKEWYLYIKCGKG